MHVLGTDLDLSRLCELLIEDETVRHALSLLGDPEVFAAEVVRLAAGRGLQVTVPAVRTLLTKRARAWIERNLP